MRSLGSENIISGESASWRRQPQCESGSSHLGASIIAKSARRPLAATLISAASASRGVA